MKQLYTCELINDNFESIFRGLFKTQMEACEAAKVYRSLGWSVQIQVIKYEGINIFTVTERKQSNATGFPIRSLSDSLR